jgi:ring-1,2-phenylacetyl-CoA epoxidase subunit PaaA
VLGVTLPDPELRWDEDAQRWHTSEIDWTELQEVIAGRGAMNGERIRNRRNAHEDGAWVREAAAEYARKQAGIRSVSERGTSEPKRHESATDVDGVSSRFARSTTGNGVAR